MACWTSGGQKNIHIVCVKHLSYVVRYRDSFDGGGNYSSCPLFTHISSSMHSTSSKHSSLRGHDPKCDLIWAFSRVTQPAGSCPKACFLPPSSCGCCSSCGCTAETHILLETSTCAPAANQCSPKERFCSIQVSSLKHFKASTWASITKTRRRGHTARILGEDRIASVYTDWWSLPSQAAFSFNTPRTDNIF